MNVVLVNQHHKKFIPQATQAKHKHHEKLTDYMFSIGIIFALCIIFRGINGNFSKIAVEQWQIEKNVNGSILPGPKSLLFFFFFFSECTNYLISVVFEVIFV